MKRGNLSSTGKVRQIDIPAELSSYCGTQPAIGICKEVEPKRMVAVASQYGIRHLIQANQPHYESELRVSEIMLTNLDTFLNYPISTILLPDRAGKASEKKLSAVDQAYRSADEKPAMVDGLRARMKVWKKSENFVSEVVLAADELFTNAIYNAPHVSFDTDKPGIPRTRENGNSPHIRPVRIFMGRDESRIVLGCEDAFGTLNPERIVTKLNVCLNKGAAAAINWEAGGAGLGTYMIFRSTLAYYAGVAKGRRTVVCCTFPVKPIRLEIAQNIHLSCFDEGTSAGG